MTVKEWAKEYPEIATSIFNCSVEDLDSVLDKKHVEKSELKYFTKADIDKLDSAIRKYMEN